MMSSATRKKACSCNCTLECDQTVHSQASERTAWDLVGQPEQHASVRGEEIDCVPLAEEIVCSVYEH